MRRCRSGSSIVVQSDAGYGVTPIDPGDGKGPMNEKRATTTHGIFERSARTYDLLNHLFSLNLDRRWRKVLVRFAGVESRGEVLDACCGTADLAIAFARRLPVRVVGVDFSENMLRVGRAKLRRRRLEGRIELLEGNVLQLPFADGRFDAAAVAFGLRNVTDRAEALVEMVRTLKPGAPLLVLEFSPPKLAFPGRLYRFYLGRIMPAVGGIVSGAPETYRYLHDSVLAFLRPEEVRHLMDAAGLQRVRVRRLGGGIVYLWRGIRAA
jgi:demethylmenaquinone methyltransferase/2-methoxy-6-polyprenyl-1,4-benzoquinol methylase